MDQLIRVPQFKFQKQVEKALGMVMEAVGPEDVLDLLPLNLIDDTPQQWVLFPPPTCFSVILSVLEQWRVNPMRIAI